MKLKLKSDEISAMFAQAGKNPLEPISPGDVLGTSVIQLNVADVRPYERNPRVTTNEKLAEIRESIRVRGLDQMFAVTKRPGESFYVTAKGGCSRLTALQQLASEISPNADRFKTADFLLVKFKSEIDLHVGHLTENLQRSDMTFWDTAKGFLDMRNELEKELKQGLSTRDFAEWLKSQGFAISDGMLKDYDFAISNCMGLAEPLRSAIGRNDIRNVLRPTFSLLQGLWGKHLGQSEDTFFVEYGFWISLFTIEPYDVHKLNEHLQRQAAQSLGYSVEQLQGMLAAYKVNRDAPLSDLIAPVSDTTEHTEAVPSVPSPIATEEVQTAFNDGDEQTGAFSPSLSDDEGDFTFQPTEDDGADGVPDPALAGDDHYSTSVSHSSVPDGLRVASGLVANGSSASKADAIANAAAKAQAAAAQSEFDGMSALDQALGEMRSGIMAIADIAGVGRYIMNAPLMPLGYFVDLPEPGVLGDSGDELAIQGWWLLANLSGQANPDLDALLSASDDAGNLALPDTGPQGYRAAFEHEDRWLNAVDACLGKGTLLDPSFLIDLLTHSNHPLTESLFSILATLKSINQLKHSTPAGHGGAQ